MQLKTTQPRVHHKRQHQVEQQAQSKHQGGHAHTLPRAPGFLRGVGQFHGGEQHKHKRAHLVDAQRHLQQQQRTQPGVAVSLLDARQQRMCGGRRHQRQGCAEPGDGTHHVHRPGHGAPHHTHGQRAGFIHPQVAQAPGGNHGPRGQQDHKKRTRHPKVRNVTGVAQHQVQQPPVQQTPISRGEAVQGGVVQHTCRKEHVIIRRGVRAKKRG